MISWHVLIAVRGDFLASYGSNDVALTEASGGGGRAFQGTTHEHAPDVLDRERAQEGLHFDPSPTASNAALLD